MISVAEALDQATQRLEDAGVLEARLDAKFLMAEVLGKERVGLSLCGQEQLTIEQAVAFHDLISRRAEREPVAKILERRAFYGLNFTISSGTLDPRVDSECLIDLALSLGPVKTVLDLGTGTGCLVLTYLHHVPVARGVGTDLSREAIDVAQENAVALGLSDRVEFALGSWTDPIAQDSSFELILSNPPYIRENDYEKLQPEVQKWDPPLALLAGPDGLAAYRDVFSHLPRVSQAKSMLCLEIGQGQGDYVRDLALDGGWRFLKSRNDLGGVERALAFVRFLS